MVLRTNQLQILQQFSSEQIVFWFGKACLILAVALAVALGDRLAEERQFPNVSQYTAEENNQAKITKLSLPAYSIIAQRNIFGEKAQTNKNQATTAPKTQLSLRLVGTNVSSGQASFAIVENKTKKEQDVFELNQIMFEQAKLLEVSPENIKIEVNGKIETLFLEDSTDSASPGIASDNSSQTDFTVPEQELTEALNNLPKLLSQARAVPYFRNGQSVGMRLFAIRQDSLYEKLGLKNGDIIRSVNNTGVGDPTQALKLFEQLKTERSVQVDVERNGQPTTLKYSIR
jgi:general secretion pathway protein C